LQLDEKQSLVDADLDWFADESLTERFNPSVGAFGVFFWKFLGFLEFLGFFLNFRIFWYFYGILDYFRIFWGFLGF
jgi:hypothetical protein